MAFIIDKHCSTCHYCYNECPVHAIGFVGSEYAIDQTKCIGCGKCETLCPGGAISNTQTPPPPRHNLQEMTCDAVVVGGGGAGLVAAVRYAEMTGKKVILLEKSRTCGGNTNLGHNFILRSSKVHTAAGYPDHRQEHAQRLWENSDGLLSRDLVYKATYAVTDMFDWMYDNSDLKDYIELVRFDARPKGFQDFMSWGAEAFIDFPNRAFHNLSSTDHSMGPGWMGTFVVRHMLERCQALGVEVYTQHAAKKILLDDNGVFCGILADDPGGETRVNAKACLLAAGGFSNGRALMDRALPAYHQGYPTHTFTVASNAGDALLMVEDIGGELDLERVKIPLFGPTHHPYPYSSVELARNPAMVMVNKLGKRFCDEGEQRGPGDHSGPLETQPDKIAFALVDTPTLEKMGADMIARSAHDPGFQACMIPWRAQLEEECTYDLAAKKADTIGALAVKIGVPAAALEDEVARYNQFCTQGVDLDFGKHASLLAPLLQGPFYSLFLSRFNEGAEGGIVNDDNLRVLKPDGSPFPGIYAAGDCCRGLIKPTDDGGKFGEMGWAVASGFLAAQELASYLP